jgi:hypothetical protein
VTRRPRRPRVNHVSRGPRSSDLHSALATPGCRVMACAGGARRHQITTSRRTGLLRTSTETGRRSARPESQRPNTRFGPGQTEPLRRPCSQSQEAQRIPSVPVREPGAALLRIRYPVPISPSGARSTLGPVLLCRTRQRSTRCASSTGHRASSRAGCSRNPKSPACPPPRTSSLC